VVVVVDGETQARRELVITVVLVVAVEPQT
jgi:hypothetical protein